MKHTDAQIEQSLARAVEESTPGSWDDVLLRLNQQKGTDTDMTSSAINQVGTVAQYKQRTHRNTWVKWAASMAAMLVIVAGLFTGYGYLTTDSIIGIDVNPSIEIKVNRMEKVLSATPLSEDAKVVLSDMNLRGVDLDVAVNALIGSMVKNGYISEIQNSILISVDSTDDQKGAELQQRLSTEVNTLLDAYQVNGAVLSQTVSEDDRLAALAQEHGISLGKAALVDLLVSQDDTLTFASVAPLSIHQINLLIADRQTELDGVATSGQASQSGYISQDEAKAIALGHAKLTEDQVTWIKAKLDSDDGHMVYEIDFFKGNTEYEYEIDATTGEILEYEHEAKTISYNTSAFIGEAQAKTIALADAGVKASDATFVKSTWYEKQGVARYDLIFLTATQKHSYEIGATTGNVLAHYVHSINGSSATAQPTPTPKPSATNTAAAANTIGEAQAKAIAFAHAGATESAVTKLEVKLDRDDGRLQYEVDFDFNGGEYDYEIDAVTGEILEYDHEVKHTTKPSATTGAIIGETKAKAVAFAHAGVSESQATSLKINLDDDDDDDDDDRAHYEVEFRVGQSKYEYEIDAVTGAILKYENDVKQSSAPTGSTGTTIGEDKARTIALNHAGVTSPTKYECKLDHDDGRQVYEIEFKSGNMEYEYEIDAATGSILKWESDHDD